MLMAIMTLAGFCVGAVESGQALTGTKVKVGDVLLGLVSSGVHSNGYSLVRRLAAGQGLFGSSIVRRSSTRMCCLSTH